MFFIHFIFQLNKGNMCKFNPKYICSLKKKILNIFDIKWPSCPLHMTKSWKIYEKLVYIYLYSIHGSILPWEPWWPSYLYIFFMFFYIYNYIFFFCNNIFFDLKLCFVNHIYDVLQSYIFYHDNSWFREYHQFRLF